MPRRKERVKVQMDIDFTVPPHRTTLWRFFLRNVNELAGKMWPGRLPKIRNVRINGKQR